MNNQAGVFKGNSNRSNQQEVLLDLFVRFLRSTWGVGPTRHGVFHETEANHANLCLVADSFRAEIHQYREAGPPEQPHHEARRPLAQSRPPTAPKKNQGLSQTQLFIFLCLLNHASTDQATTSFRSSMLVAWGFGAALAHPRNPKSNSLLSGADKTSLPLAAALRGGRAPSLASLVANGCFLTSCVLRI